MYIYIYICTINTKGTYTGTCTQICIHRFLTWCTTLPISWARSPIALLSRHMPKQARASLIANDVLGIYIYTCICIHVYIYIWLKLAFYFRCSSPFLR